MEPREPDTTIEELMRHEAVFHSDSQMKATIGLIIMDRLWNGREVEMEEVVRLQLAGQLALDRGRQKRAEIHEAYLDSIGRFIGCIVGPLSRLFKI